MIIEMDVSATPERNLLSQVVLSALNDACKRPRKQKNANGVEHLRISRDAFTAMRFLFDPDVAGLNEYALWLDFNADQARTKLLKLMKDDGPNKIGDWDPMDRRTFRINYKLWQHMKIFEQSGIDFDEDEDDNDLA